MAGGDGEIEGGPTAVVCNGRHERTAPVGILKSGRQKPSPLVGEGAELPKAARRVRGSDLRVNSNAPLTRLVAR